MENYIPIELHQTRDFSKKMNATFEFIKHNFKALSKSILFIAGPPVLAVSMVMGSFIGDMFNFIRTAATGGDPEFFQNYILSVSFWLQIGVALVFMLVSMVSAIATINNYIILYGEKRTNNIEVKDVWDRVRATFWMYLGTVILFWLLAIALYSLVAVIIGLTAAVSIALIFLVVPLVVCGFIYLFISASMVFIIRGYERVGFLDALVRSFKLIQGKWWSTCGLLIVLHIIVSTVSSVFSIPVYTVMMVWAMHSVDAGGIPETDGWFPVTIMVFFTLYYFLQMLLYSFPNVGIAFQYFNLVEMKEAPGLMDKIGSIGQPPSASTSAQDEHY